MAKFAAMWKGTLLLLLPLVIHSGCQRRVTVAVETRDVAGARRLHAQALRLAASWYPADTERALLLLDSAARLDPAFHDAHYMRFLLNDQLGRNEAATSALDEARALRPYEPTLAMTAGIHHEIRGDTLLAFPYYAQAERLFAAQEQEASEGSLPWRQTVDRALNLLLAGHADDGRALLQFARFTARYPEQRSTIDHLLLLPRNQLLHAAFPDKQEVLDRMLEHHD